MTDTNPSSAAPLPPAPPTKFGATGCVRVGLMGCGGLLVLGIILFVAAGIWLNRNSGQMEGGARDGARFGLARDEEACMQEAQRRAAEATGLAQTMAVGGFLRGCLEYSQPTQGFCDNVPAPTRIRESAVWQQHRCGDNAYCKGMIQVVQTYCTEGRPKRTAADTLLMGGSGDAGGPGGDGS